MNTITRGIRNAFRNVVRTISIVVILGLSIGLALTMLVAHQAVGQKIASIKGSVGNTITVSPAGVRGFEGGGNPLTVAELSKVQNLPHVTSVTESLADRLTTSDTNLQSAITAGSLGQRFSQNSGQSFVQTQQVNSGGFAGGGGGGGFTTTFTPPVTVDGSNNPTDLNLSQGGGSFTLKSGSVFAANSAADIAVVGDTLATKNNLVVGSTFTAYGTTIKVIGIFDAGNTFSDNQVIMPLATVQSLASEPGDITTALVNVDSITNVSSVTTAVQNALGTSVADVTNSEQQAQTTITPLNNVQTISLYSLIGAVIAGAVIILLVMIMIVRERRREIGVIKAIGASNRTIVGQFMTEAVTLTLLGAIIGIMIGFLAGSPITKLLVDNSSTSTTTSIGGPGGPTLSVTSSGGGGGLSRGAGRFLRNNLTSIHAAVGYSIILYGLAAAIIIAIIGSAMASFFIAKIRPAEVMRVE